MWGAIIGDLAGSIYEFEQTKKIAEINVQEIIPSDAFYSDDTILTIAILDAFLNGFDYDKYLKMYVKKYEEYKPNHTPYFNSTFSPRFMKWALEGGESNSSGNGAMMRISPIGFLSNSLEELEKNVCDATKTSHNSKEAINSALIVAKIIYLARKDYKKEKIISELNLRFKYIPFKKFNVTCYETLNNCLFALFESNSFEEAITKIISFGGDTDTNACIVGSMAEALYEIDIKLIKKAKRFIPAEFVNLINKGYKRIIL